MRKYKVYAKILGYVLPDEVIEIKGCKIERMPYKEQKERGFKPIEGRAFKPQRMSYLSFPRGADFRIMQSEYVVSTILDHGSPNEAVGLAEGRFNKLIGALMLYMDYWTSNHCPGSKIRLYEYDYQICKMYEIVDGKEIEIKELRPTSSGAFMCKYPAHMNFADDFEKIIEYLDCKDKVFINSLEYFVDGIRGIISSLPEEKILLDLFKAIESIIRELKIKRKSFKTRIKIGLKKIGLDDEEIKNIIEFYKIRSDGNLAHSSIKKFGFPHQYPKPHDAGYYLYDIYQLKTLSHKALINYFNYIKDRYEVSINHPKYKDSGRENKLVQIIENFSIDSWNHKFIFNTKEKNKRKRTPLIKREFAKVFDVSLNQIKVLESKSDGLVLELGQKRDTKNIIK